MTDNVHSSRESSLVRNLGLLDATMIVIGSMIGSGIFIVSAESSRLIGAPGWLLLTWVVAGLLTITGALCCAELATMMPRAGGVYVFLREAYGPALGFLFGWTLFLVVQTGTIAAVAIAFARFLGVFVPPIAGDHYLVAPIIVLPGYAVSLSSEQLVAILLIAFLTFLNTRGLRVGRIVQNSFTFTKTVALFGRHRHWAALRLEIELRGTGLALVECAGERLEPAGRTTGIRRGRRTRYRVIIWESYGRPGLRTDRVDQRHFYR